MAAFDFDIGILGGGAAGLTIASGSAQLGARTLLVERQSVLGGDCLHFGCVPSKTLIRSAQVYHLVKHSGQFGLPVVDPPPVDFQQIVRRIRSVIGAIQKHDSEERFCGLGVKVEFGQAVFTDEHTVELNGRRITSKHWVIATGASPSAPPVDGLDQSGYITNRDVFFMDRLPGSMIILGGGPIAMEMAQAFCRLGSKVSVIQRSDQILTREDRDMADDVMKVLQQEGVRFFLNTSILAVRDTGGQKEVVFRQKGLEGSFVVAADSLLVAMGREANLTGLGLENIGVKFTRKGLSLDDRLRTRHNHIYGAGDVTGAFQFTHAAGYEGGIVISNSVFHFPRKIDYTYLPWCTYTDPGLASIGMNEKRAGAAGINYSVRMEAFSANDRSLAEGEARGRIKLILDDKGKPIGVQIFSLFAGELLNEWVAVFNGGVRLSTLAAAVHPYPTVGESSKKVAGAVMADKLFSDPVKKGLKFFFHLKGRACELPDKLPKAED
ncbi:MAG: FAD-dependent oxidoreductase [Desulfobacterales bacterium]|nr:FAD-dependent oxidoreductase [Desulfobacterales bacterium]MDD4072457.1 FAD-dependent oxidoreductase [Desulfobacterales bacterium]MDD4393155.1 FAD-dependent oxidoreductase [Desulfobacterales bacterium]